MGTLVALYKPFDLSLQNLIKYKYLLCISFLFGLVSTVPFYPRKKKEKKGNERVRREKGKKGPDVLTSLFAFSLLLSSQLICVTFFFFAFCGFSFLCHFLLVFNLLFVKINK